MLCANTAAKVISLDDGRELGANETGEICARGPQIAMGYLNNPRATKETFDKDGFLHTGDVGFIDDEGLIHISDRIKEMIKSELCIHRTHTRQNSFMVLLGFLLPNTFTVKASW